MSTTTRFSFPRELRIRKRHEFRRVYRLGGRARGRHLQLVVLENRLGNARLGLSVGKKHGCAVRRNRIKRMVREAFRLSRAQIEARLGAVDLVVIPAHADGKYPLAEICDELPGLAAAAKARQSRRSGRRGGRRGRRRS